MTHCPACKREFPDDVEVCPTDGTAAHRVGEQPDPLVGQTIRGRYRVLRKLGEGSGGTAYLAEQVKIRRSVVLKFLREELAGDDILLERFRREARTLARLDPRYVTRVHDLDQTDAGRLFVVMEYLEGRTLRQVLEAEGQLTLARTLALSVQIAEGLRVAHSGGVLHRGVKPQTVMVLPDETVKLTDFGVTARLQVPAVPSDASAPELEYAPPEQRLASAESEHGDLYSLGVVLYEMLTGVLPPALTPGGEAGAKAPAPPGQLRPGVPRHLDELVLQMLHPDPARRPRDMDEVVRRLRSAMAAARTSGAESDETAVPPARSAGTTAGLRSSRPGGPPSSPPATRADPVAAPAGGSAARETHAAATDPRLKGPMGPKRGRTLAVSATLALVAGLVVATALTLRSPSAPPGPATAPLLDSAARPDPAPPAPASAAQAPPARTAPDQTSASQAGAAQTTSAQEVGRAPATQSPPASAPAQSPAPAAQGAAAVLAGQPAQAGDAARPPPSSGEEGGPASPGASSPTAPPPAISSPVAASGPGTSPAGSSPSATSPVAPSPVSGASAPASSAAGDRPPAGARAGKAGGPDSREATRSGRVAVSGEGEREQPAPAARPATPPALTAPPGTPQFGDGPATAAAPVRDPGRLQAAVQDRLRAGGLLRDGATGPVGVSVEAGADGAVTLTGVLATRSDRERAIALTRAIPGVTAVRSRINVRESWGGS